MTKLCIVFGLIKKDIQREIDLARAGKSGGNFLPAPGLLCYTEFMGTMLLKRKGSDKSVLLLFPLLNFGVLLYLYVDVYHEISESSLLCLLLIDELILTLRKWC
jgi:hypothetical protein